MSIARHTKRHLSVCPSYVRIASKHGDNRQSNNVDCNSRFFIPNVECIIPCIVEYKRKWKDNDFAQRLTVKDGRKVCVENEWELTSARPTVSFPVTLKVVAWLTGGALVSINEVTVRRVRLWAGKPPRFLTSNSGQLCLLPSAGRKISTGQSAVTLCGWGVKAAGMVHFTCG